MENERGWHLNGLILSRGPFHFTTDHPFRYAFEEASLYCFYFLWVEVQCTGESTASLYGFRTVEEVLLGMHVLFI